MQAIFSWDKSEASEIYTLTVDQKRLALTGADKLDFSVILGKSVP